MYLLCSVDEERTAVELLSDTNIELAPDGTASWTTPALLKSACKINIDLYPFDVQVQLLPSSVLLTMNHKALQYGLSVTHILTFK